jgi:hypothetical protein
MSRIDVENTKYHERRDLKIGPKRSDDFTRSEMLKIHRLLRRLRFLETQMRLKAGSDPTSSAAIHTAEEADALEWVLGRDGLDFLAPIKESKT